MPEEIDYLDGRADGWLTSEIYISGSADAPAPELNDIGGTIYYGDVRLHFAFDIVGDYDANEEVNGSSSSYVVSTFYESGKRIERGFKRNDKEVYLIAPDISDIKFDFTVSERNRFPNYGSFQASVSLRLAFQIDVGGLIESGEDGFLDGHDTYAINDFNLVGDQTGTSEAYLLPTMDERIKRTEPKSRQRGRFIFKQKQEYDEELERRVDVPGVYRLRIAQFKWDLVEPLYAVEMDDGRNFINVPQSKIEPREEQVT